MGRCEAGGQSVPSSYFFFFFFLRSSSESESLLGFFGFFGLSSESEFSSYLLDAPERSHNASPKPWDRASGPLLLLLFVRFLLAVGVVRHAVVVVPAEPKFTHQAQLTSLPDLHMQPTPSTQPPAAGRKPCRGTATSQAMAPEPA